MSNSNLTAQGSTDPSTEFDPFFKWLGIPPEEQPPNHYRLLAIPPFTSDPEVIENAADQRMAHLKSVQTGKRGALSQTLLDQIAQAKICLLDQDQKVAYDETLRSSLVPPVAPPPVQTEFEPPSVDQEHVETTFQRRGNPRQATSPIAEFIKVVLGGVAGLAVGYLLICWISPKNDFLGIFASSDEKKTNQAQPTPVVEANAFEQRRPVVEEAIVKKQPNDSSHSVSPTSAEEKPKPVEAAPVPADKQAALAIEREAALAKGDLIAALRAVSDLAALMGKSELEEQLSVLSTWKAESPAARREVAAELAKLLEQAVAESKFDLSSQHVDQLLALARSLDDQELARRATLIALKRGKAPTTPQAVAKDGVDSKEYHARLLDPKRRSRAEMICAFRRLLTDGNILPVEKAPDQLLDEIIERCSIWTEWHVLAIGLSTELDLPSFEKVFGTPRPSKNNFGGLTVNEVEWTFGCKDGDVVFRGFWQETPKGKSIHFETARFRRGSNSGSAAPQAGPSIANEAAIEQFLASIPNSSATQKHGGKLKDLDCRGVVLSDSQLEIIGSIESLRVLYLPQTKLNDAGLKKLATLSSLEVLGIWNTDVTDEGMQTIATFTHLRNLSVEGNGKIGDRGVAYLSGLADLSDLGLSWTNVTDDGLRSLVALPSLKSLGLNHTKITDRGLEHLAKIKTLTRLSIVETAVTDSGVAKFKAALPSCEVVRVKP